MKLLKLRSTHPNWLRPRFESLTEQRLRNHLRKFPCLLLRFIRALRRVFQPGNETRRFQKFQPQTLSLVWLIVHWNPNRSVCEFLRINFNLKTFSSCRVKTIPSFSSYFIANFPRGLPGSTSRLNPVTSTVSTAHIRQDKFISSLSKSTKKKSYSTLLLFTGLLPRDGSILCPKRTQENHP